ncbi:MAG: nucleotidyltransferase domain-containing protein [Thermoplasmata archaeon]|nr:nucleotidyltransferase domain-containing protein [Thermoplasmata archaeon]
MNSLLVFSAGLFGKGAGGDYVHIIKHMSDILDMRFHNPLDDLLGNPIRLKLLRALVRQAGRGFTGRELARLCDASPSQVCSSLVSLEASGVVFREIAGRSHVWRLSEKHLLSETLTRLFRDETHSLNELKSDLEGVIQRLPVQGATIFGSVARGDERTTSDVDLLVRVKTRAEREQVEDALSAASFAFVVKFGNPLSAVVMDSAQQRNPPNPELLKNSSRDGLELETAE